MFIVEIGSVLTTLLFFRDLGEVDGADHTSSPAWSPPGCGSPCCSPTSPRRSPRAGARPRPTRCARPGPRPSPSVRLADGSVIEKVRRPRSSRRRPVRRRRPGELIPGDGEIVEGIATRRRVGHHRRVGTGDPGVRRRPVGRHRRHPGPVRPDRRAHHPEAGRGLHRPHDRPGRGGGAGRRRPTRSPSTSSCAGLTIIFLLATVTLQPFAIYSGGEQSIVVLVALLVCLIPTTIGGLLSAIGIAGMDRLVQRNVLAMSGRAVEAAGDVSTLLLDKTGTITYGNRMAAAFLPVAGVDRGRAGRGRAPVEPGRRDARGPVDRRAGRAALRPGRRARARRRAR